MHRSWPTTLKVGATIILSIVIVALAAPLIAPFSPVEADPTNILAPPSATNWLGTDNLGRDNFSRLVFGARASLAVAFAVAIISVGLGAILGGGSALAGGAVDTVLMRIVDILVSLPALVIALALSAVLGPSLTNLAVILGLLGAPFFARMFRSEALSIAQQNYVRSARLMGGSFPHILLRHVIPNLGPLFATLLSGALSGALLAASALSFIGLGAQPPTPEWGALIYEGRNTIMYEWWCAIPPGIAIAFAATGFVLFGDGLRDVLDPRTMGRS